jgi:hypothetical protein
MIARGQMTLVVIGWANRDENIFHNPYELDITREPNKHMSFGHGIYLLPGSAACSFGGRGCNQHAVASDTRVALKCAV